MNIITTNDLILREWEAQDEWPLIQIARQDHVQHWLPDWDHPEAWIGKWIVNVRNHYQIDNPKEGFISYAVTLRDTGELIGQMSVGGDDFDGDKVGIAYFMSERYLRRGLTTQAALAFSDYLFERYGYDDLNSIVQVSNIASNKVLMNAGYTRVGTIVKQLDGHPAPMEFVHWRKVGRIHQQEDIMSTLHSQYDQVIASIAALQQVQSIGKSGGGELPQTGESDIDIFVFCTNVPSCEARNSAVRVHDFVTDAQISEHSGEFWGVCDFVSLGETEVCLMYFTIKDMNAEIDAVLQGQRLGKQDGYFYPTGRCATIMSMHILCDKHGYIAALKQKLADYPEALSAKLVAHHTKRLANREDIERGVSRKDPLFYHFALDIALDHFLQALFALNRCYFPSRKRSIQYIVGFSKKPEACSDRLLNIIELGGKVDTIAQSYEDLIELCDDLEDLVQ